MLEELLKKYLADDEKVTQFLKDMKASKIYLSSEENVDKRYKKLQSEFTAKEAEHQQALDLIEQLKSDNAGNEALQGKITEYESTIANLQAQNKQLAKENALKVALLSNKAKAEDIDYLMFKLSKDEDAVKLDDNGEITNIQELIDGMKTTYPSHFESGAKKKVDVNKLPADDGKGKTMTKEEFLKKPYAERAQFAQDNPEAFQVLNNE